MGQALDRDGQVLDEAFGKTKREVFDRLNERNPDAHEIRIKTLQGRVVSELTVNDVARICHEANRAYCLMTGDQALPAWDELNEIYRESCRMGVRGALRGTTPEESHAGWMLERLGQGWKYGPVLDREAKVHPNLVPYDQLPEAQQRKDALFLGIVEAILGGLR